MKMLNKNFCKLENVEPFNGYFFRSCYYHQLIAGYSHFGIDKKFVLMNFLPLYSYEEETDSYKMKGIDLFSASEMEKSTGIRLKVKSGSADVVKKALYELKRNRPVIVAVDASLLPYREDVYQKSPINHYLLLYGFDLNAKEFIVMEHLYANSQIYRESRIGFDLLEKAFDAAVKNFRKENARMFVSLRQMNTKTARPLVLNKSYGEEIAESYDFLKKLILRLKQIYENEDDYFEKAASLPTFYASYALRKRVQLNCFDRNAQLSEQILRIIDNISFVLGVTQKSIVTRRFDTQLGTKIVNRLDEVLGLEKSVHEVFARFYVKGRQLWE